MSVHASVVYVTVEVTFSPPGRITDLGKCSSKPVFVCEFRSRDYPQVNGIKAEEAEERGAHWLPEINLFFREMEERIIRRTKNAFGRILPRWVIYSMTIRVHDKKPSMFLGQAVSSWPQYWVTRTYDAVFVEIPRPNFHKRKLNSSVRPTA